MDGISPEEIRSVEDAITRKILETYNIGLEKLALDYTNHASVEEFEQHFSSQLTN